jgi:flagellar basal body P-ring formation protein FlgA
MKLALTLLLMLLAPMAQAQQDPQAVRKTAELFAKQRTANLAGRVTVVTGAVDASALPACARLEAFLPANTRLWGAVNVGVRCAQGANWSLYVPVQVRVQGAVVVAARPLTTGQQLVADDLATQEAELTQLPNGTITDLNEAIGKTMTFGVVAGAPLRQDMLRAPFLVRQGGSVKLVAEGQGFRVYSEGKAMNNAAVGQTVQVKTPNGQLVSGTVRADGSVEVRF